VQLISLVPDPSTPEGDRQDVVALKKEENEDLTHNGKAAKKFQIKINLAEEETRKWRSQVTSDLNALKGKLWELDRLTTRHRQSLKQITSYAEIDQDKCCGLITFSYLVKTSWASRLQLILLLTVFIVFGWYATSYFYIARENELAAWKPLKITRAIEYGTTDMQYEMPYVLIAFSINNTGTWWKSQNEILSEIEASQWRPSGRCSIRYFSKARRDPVKCEDSVSRFEGRPTVSNSTFWGYFRFKLENPSPANGAFVWSVTLNAEKMVLIDNIEIGGFYVSITRDEIPADFSKFIFLNAESPLAVNAGIAYTVDYTETIVDNIHYITNSIAWSTELSSYNGTFRFTARPNLRVESYSEYVVFGYSDWVFGMGGLYNVFAVGFFYAAYYAAVFCNDNWSMGILPQLSFIFQNFEMVLWLKHNTLKQEDIDDSDLNVEDSACSVHV